VKKLALRFAVVVAFVLAVAFVGVVAAALVVLELETCQQELLQQSFQIEFLYLFHAFWSLLFLEI